MSAADDAVAAEPWAQDFFAALRRLERINVDQPRIGASGSRREDYVSLGQEPFLDFPAATISAVSQDAQGRARIFVKFLGLLGPQGALPLATTEEAHGWWLAHDDAFPRFLDLFNHRFLQLFFRAWADSRPVAHHDRPGQDRFADYLGSLIGMGTPCHRGLDSLDDMSKLAHAGLVAPRVKSASRLRRFIAGLFGVEVKIEQFVGSWLPLEPAERSTLGQRNSVLGGDILLGSRVFSVLDKFRVRLLMRDLDQYKRFLPNGDLSRQLADAVFFYVGAQIDWDVELALPAEKAEGMRLGQAGRLGWTGWLAPDWAGLEGSIRTDARLSLGERLRPSKGASI